MALPYNDPDFPIGSKVLTINSVTYVATNISVDDPGRVIERRNEIGNPSGQKILEDFVTGSATIQLATTSTPIPEKGMTFAADLLDEGENQTWVIAGRTIPRDQMSETLPTITFRKRINTP